MPTAVTDRLDLTLGETKTYLRVEHDEEDDLITDLINTAKASADTYLNNPFTGRTIPHEVKIWCLRRVAYLYEQRVENLSLENVAGVGSADYGARFGQAPLDYTLIRPHRLNPGL